MTIGSRLYEKINRRPDLRIKEKRKARIEEIFIVRIDQARGRPIEMTKLKIERAAETSAELVVEGAEAQFVIELIEKILRAKFTR